MGSRLSFDNFWRHRKKMTPSKLLIEGVNAQPLVHGDQIVDEYLQGINWNNDEPVDDKTEHDL